MGSAPQRSSDSFDDRPSNADAPKSRNADERPGDPSSNGASSLDELRHLILAPEQEALDHLHERIDNPESRTADVSGVVAEAIQRRREQGGGDALSEALAPTIQTALRESVRKDPGALADALFPVMGPAIRRSILETLRSFLASFNQVLDQSLSWQGLKWRVEAIRTGRSFTEVALLHSLVFRVEQVFLIHKKTGLPIAHAVAPAVAMQDPSLVSGMLSAIQDFVRDSFQAGQGQSINRLNVGDLDVCIESGPYAILAAVIRGVAPRSLDNRLAETLENIHAEYSSQLSRFAGDTEPFAHIDQDLARCLESKFREESQPKSRGHNYVLVAGVCLAALIAIWAGWRWWQSHRWNQLAAALNDQPGIAVTSIAREHGRYLIRGLRDPLAFDPQKFIADAHLDPAQAEFHWVSYYALDDALIQQRATSTLAPPQGVNLSVTDGVLHVSGQPPTKWLTDLRSRALFIPGIRSIDLQSSTQEQTAFADARNKLQTAIVRFPVASATLSSAERTDLQTLIPAIKELLNSSSARTLRIEILGHSDATGAEGTNRNLSQKRADRIESELVRAGIPRVSLAAKGVANSDPVRPENNEENRQFNRSATFRVLTTPSQP
jgi:OOP family OmpA-OmpF porin